MSKSAGTLIKPLTEAAVQRVYGGLAFADAWSQSVQNLPACLGITQEDKALIVQFGTGLGSSDTDGQILHCTMYQEFFKERLKAAKDKKDKKVKLYHSLGAFGGIALALFII